jgi:hypothetical protein
MSKMSGRADLRLAVSAFLFVWTCAASAQQHPAEAVSTVRLDLIADGFTAPVDLASPPDGSGRRFLIDQAGLVHILDERGTLLSPPFLDLRDRMLTLTESFEERGLLGFAFHPEFAENGRVFVSYSAPLRPQAPAGWNYTRRSPSSPSPSPAEPIQVGACAPGDRLAEPQA